MDRIDLLSGACLLAGAGFFLAGTVGLLRFPDVFTRLHALAKVDNLGLGFTVLGLLSAMPDPHHAARLLVVWLLGLGASGTVCFLVARRSRQEDGSPP